ncbi:MAG: histidine phosphatase family protein, partial [Ruminococcus sp.]|nr:histidine phosphatase family protein [Ruminococcus sp.]
KRAVQTAAPIADALGIIPVTDERLREWDYGSFEGKPRNTDGFAESKLEFGCRMPEGGESVFDLVSRTYGLLDDVRKRYAGTNVLIVSHGGVCRVIETYYKNMTVREFSQFFMGNCEIRLFEAQPIV